MSVSADDPVSASNVWMSVHGEVFVYQRAVEIFGNDFLETSASGHQWS